MTTVVAILQVYLGLPYEVILGEEVPVPDLNRQLRLHREGDLLLKAPVTPEPGLETGVHNYTPNNYIRGHTTTHIYYT